MDGEFSHYGVLGMKWGVRKDRRKTYSKAIGKLRTIDKKVVKAGTKADSLSNKAAGYQQKATKAMSKATTQKKLTTANKLQVKANKYQQKANAQSLKTNRSVEKARKWVTAMDKVFSGTDYKDLDPDDVAFGKQYAEFLFDYERRRR